MTTTTSQTLLVIGNPHFANGYRLGRLWYFVGEWERPIDDEYVLTNIRSYCERGLHNDVDWLAERVGFLLGMVSGTWISEEVN